MMNVQNVLLASESYTHENWVYPDVYVGFSRLYYIIDGEGYYEENGKAIRFRKNHLYLTPVKKRFSLYENPENKLLHTYCHITTQPAVLDFIEIEVVEGTPLADAVALWRKYIHSGDTELLTNVIRFLLSCIGEDQEDTPTVAAKIKSHIDSLRTYDFDMESLGREMGYSREHLTRCFRTAYRTTPKKYFHFRRMNEGLRLLLEGRSVTETAELLQYATPYSFSKAFKNHFGFSPERYLRILK